MRFENEFEVAGRPSEVIEKLDDAPLVASFLPGASVGPVNADGSYPATLVVSFGPKRLAFKGTITNRVDRESYSGVLSGTASTDVRGARMAVKMNYSLAQCEGSQQPARTQVKFVSEAQLTGVLAEFAKTGGVVVANAIVAEFARGFSAQFAPPAQTSAPATTAPATLSATSVMAEIFRSMLRTLRTRVSSIWRGSRPPAS